MPRLSENAISFFGAGGHKHDGVSSTLISTDKYSLFDFNPGYRGSQSRITIQQANQSALEEWVMNLVNTKVLAPAGLDLAPGLLSGKSIRANTITATELQANTITADEIAANAVTANELAANLVLVNNVIRSNNYNGTIAANGAITANGNAGWAITSFGSAEFSNAVIRGNVTANAGSIGGWTISSNTITAGSTTLSSTGAVTFGNTVIASNGQITNGGYTLSNTGVLTATGANINGTINASDGFIGGININASEIQSNGFSAGFAGFRIGADGNSEFNNVTIRGDLDAGTVGGLVIDGGNLVAGDVVADDSYGGYVQIEQSGQLLAYRKDFNYGIGEYYVKVDVMGAEPGIVVSGTANGSVNSTRILSSSIFTKTIFLNGTSIATSLAGKSPTTHDHNGDYAPTHSHPYVNTTGDTMTGILYGTSIDMTNNLRYGGQVYSDDSSGYAEFGAVGAPTSIGGRVFRFNQAYTLWDRTLSVTGSRPVYVNSDSTLFCGATASSLRYKNNVVSSSIDIKSFLELDVVDFYYNDEFYEDSLKKTKELGIIAEQVHEKGLFDLVRYDELERPDGLNDNKIPFYLLKACIEQQKKINELEDRIQALEGV